MFDIRSQHRVAIVKTGLQTNFEQRAFTVGRHLHIAGEQTIARAGFVQRTGQQGVKHQVRQVSRGIALDRERVVFVKGGHPQVADQPQFATFGGVGVHIVEVTEVRRVFQVAPQRVAVCGP